MNAAAGSPVVQALRNPPSVLSWTAWQWEMLVRQAYSADLLSRIAALLEELQLLERVPTAPRARLIAAQRLAQAQAQEVHREVSQIMKALARTGVDVVLLKGAAYLFARLPAAHGRVFSDVDILVPKDALAEVEAALMLHGWASSHLEPYDQRYYRQWMHELPPLQHVARATVLDVHHSIAPPTGRLKPDSNKLLASAVPVPGHPKLKVLAPADMVLHSAAHLFLNEELSHGLRDLVDIDALLRHFGAADEFWTNLHERAAELDLEAPLAYALRYTAGILGTPVPSEAGSAARLAAWRWTLLDALYLRALRPHHPEAEDSFTPLARQALFVRGHWLRMPPWLLAWHLAVKSMRRAKPPLSQQGAR
ncbi:MAG TPA: nucleotidyltransferase family protein [Burkholderiales bacterium]|nr:nucleotidyltransferase family protein [Burkholderiales bacterium]